MKFVKIICLHCILCCLHYIFPPFLKIEVIKTTSEFKFLLQVYFSTESIYFKSRKRFNSPAGDIKTFPSASYYFFTVYVFIRATLIFATR